MITWIWRRFAIPGTAVILMALWNWKFESDTRTAVPVEFTVPAAVGKRIASAGPLHADPLKSSAVPTMPSGPGSHRGCGLLTKTPLLHTADPTLHMVDQVAWPMSRAVNIDSIA